MDYVGLSMNLSIVLQPSSHPYSNIDELYIRILISLFTLKYGLIFIVWCIRQM